MKKYLLTIATFYLCILGSFAQVSILSDHPNGNQESPVLKLKSATTTTGFGSSEGSVFYYPPVSYDNAYTSDAEKGFKCYQSFAGATGSFDAVKIWAVTANSSGSPRELKVEVYEAGETPGTLVSSTVLTVTPENTGEVLLGSYTIYSYSIHIPTTSLTSGWISVEATNSGVGNTFYWLDTYTTPAFAAFQNSDSLTGTGLSMSLISAMPVPVPYWAIGLIFLLIAFAYIIRYKINMHKISC